MNYDFAKCKYTAADLKNKTVYARVLVDNSGIVDSGIVEGEATFDAIQNEHGLVKVRINFHYFEKGPSGRYVAISVFIPSESLDKIVKNPKGSKYDFSLNTVGGELKPFVDPFDWTDKRFTVEDVNQNSADIAIKGEDGRPYDGHGVVQAIANGEFIRVRIVYFPSAPDGKGKMTAAYYQVPSNKSSKLVKNPEGSKNLFSFKDL